MYLTLTDVYLTRLTESWLAQMDGMQHILFWWIVPALATRVILSILYSIAFKKTPLQGSKQQTKHHNIVYTTVVVLYLLYTITMAVVELPSNYYSILDLQPSQTTPKAIKANHRSLSLQFHPDKVVPNSSCLTI